MTGGVLLLLSVIPADGDDRSVVYDDTTDWYIPRCFGPLRFHHGEAHERFSLGVRQWDPVVHFVRSKIERSRSCAAPSTNLALLPVNPCTASADPQEQPMGPKGCTLAPDPASPCLTKAVHVPSSPIEESPCPGSRLPR